MIDAHDPGAVRIVENPSKVEGENRSHDVGIQEEKRGNRSDYAVGDGRKQFWRGQSG